MGIHKKVVYIAQCDNCSEVLEHSDGGWQGFDDKEQANKILKECDWTKKNGKLYCANCWEH